MNHIFRLAGVSLLMLLLAACGGGGGGGASTASNNPVVPPVVGPGTGGGGGGNPATGGGGGGNPPTGDGGGGDPTTGDGGGGDPTTGGGSEDPPLPNFPFSAEMARSLVGGQAAPSMTLRQLAEESGAILTAADTVIMGDVVFADRGVAGFSRGGQVTCMQGTCTESLDDGDILERFSLDAERIWNADYEGYRIVYGRGLTATNHQLVMVANGVPLIQSVTVGRVEDAVISTQEYGGWLNESAFVVASENVDFDDDTPSPTQFVFYTLGNDSGSNPTGTGSATWNGVMSGVKRTSVEARYIAEDLQGDATVRIDDLAVPDVDVTFTNIKNLVDGSDVADMSWGDLVVSGGSFEAADGSIEGVFYGATHDEVGGVFDRNDIIGAFGAVRAAPE